MNSYMITMVAESAANIWGADLNGYVFETIPDNAAYVEITKTIDAESWRDALTQFNKELFSVLDAIALHRASAVSAYGVTTAINRNSESFSLVLSSTNRPGTGMTLSGGTTHTRQQEEIMRLAASGDVTLEHFRRSLLTTGANSAALHLLQAAESLAGTTAQSVKCDNCNRRLKCAHCYSIHSPSMTDRTKLKQVLGDDLFNFYYERQPGETNTLRNKLAHGYYVDENLIASKHDELTDSIRYAIKDKYSLHHTVTISGARPLRQIERRNHFVMHETEPLPDLITTAHMIKEREIELHTEPYYVLIDEAPSLNDY